MKIKFWLILSFIFFVILYFSSQDGATSHIVSTSITDALTQLLRKLKFNASFIDDHLVRKCAHFSEYFVLSIFLYTLSSISYKKVYNLKVILFGVLFATLDELHQSFIPERTPLLPDVLIDTSGFLLGFLVCFILERFCIGKRGLNQNLLYKRIKP
jgi:VanZ family protein